jgi:ferredoxin
VRNASEFETEVPKDLRLDPATLRDSKEEAYFHWAFPLEDFWHTHPGEAFLRLNAYSETAPLMKEHWEADILECLKRAQGYHRLPPTGSRTGEDLTGDFHAEAARIGLGLVGVTRFHRAYVFGPYRDKVRYRNIIITGQVTPPDLTNTLTPSVETQDETHAVILDATRKSFELADFIRSRGYRVQFLAGVIGLEMVNMLPYAEAAGMGQLGANGQLLSPYFGSRWRPVAMSTDAPLQHGSPRDFGIAKLCEKCQVCVRRCPGRALSNRRVHYRGVLKYKVIPERCLPMMLEFSDCGVCIRVCPVQRYGLERVLEHYTETGTVLGKGSDELEGYELKGRGYFPAGKLPVFSRDEASLPYDRLTTLPADSAPWPPENE